MRLIDATAWIKAFCGDCGYVEYGLCTKDDPMCRGLEVMNEVPTVDAVEVIRCEECTHWDSYKFVNPDIGMCIEHVTLKRKNGFCDSGERKNNG